MITSTGRILRDAFQGLDEGTIDQLRAVAQSEYFPHGTVICQQGEKGNSFYVIVEGQVAITQALDDDEERLLDILGPHRYFGEMSLLDETPRMATCTAVTDVTALVIDEPAFDELINNSPALAYGITVRTLGLLRNIERLAILDLTEKNKELAQAYANLKAAQADIVIKERLMRELELAAAIQNRLLPNTLPQYEDCHFAALLRPALRVGGDFYDVVHIDDEHVGVLIADVADKGIHAALFMAVTYTLFRSSCRDFLSPAEVVLDVHRHLLDTGVSDMFVTAIYGVLHRPSGRFTYVRAGHERPFLYRPGQPVSLLPADGRFIGMLPGLKLKDCSVQLQPGDRVLLVSDGVPDAVNPRGEQYGNERFTAVLEEYGHLPAAELCQQLLGNINAWQQDAPPFDDLTMLAIEMSDLMANGR
jgi:serine phosphatase RsbU (regulator of sigma subunit)